jgi:DinB superfamily
MSVQGDTKDWTWVLERACPDCGLDTREPAREDLAGLVRADAAVWTAILGGGQDLSRRPQPSMWSTVEYGCHVRDVYRLGAQRLALMVERPGATFDNWDQDVTAVEGRYRQQDPVTVALGLQAAASRVAHALEATAPGEWAHAGRRSNGSLFTVESFARYVLHDVVHHVWDVTGRRYDGPV